MASYKPNEDEIFETAPGYTLATGGIKKFETTELKDKEVALIQEFIDDEEKHLQRISPKIAEDFKGQENILFDLASHFKARVGDKPYSDLIRSPSTAGELGINPIIPQFLNANDLTVDLTEGTEGYLWGSGTSYFTTSSTPDQRYMIFVMQGGIIQINDTPFTNQFLLDTTRTSYTPFAVNPMTIETIEENRTIYQYPTTAGYLLNWDTGSRLSFMPYRAGSSVSYYLIGAVLHEYGAFDSLKWI